MNVPPQKAVQALFAAAREDAPEDAQRDAMWGRVAVATGLAAGAAAAATAASSAPGALTTATAATSVAAATTGAASSAASATLTAKLVVLGGIIGACGTALGVVITLLVVAPSSSGPAASPSRGAAVVAQRSVAPGARLANPEARRRDTTSDDRATARTSASVAAAAAPPVAASTVAPVDTASGLAEEARLVTEARAALVQGDAARALALVSATKRIANRSLEPEELGLEARALRALGRADEAAATELLLKRRFPDSALAR